MSVRYSFAKQQGQAKKINQIKIFIKALIFRYKFHDTQGRLHDQIMRRTYVALIHKDFNAARVYYNSVQGIPPARKKAVRNHLQTHIQLMLTNRYKQTREIPL
jgi:hypothetical protein